ncbi:RNA polymerase sigma factor [Paenibacillus piscarius]|uniref:RNA polymerase sigma factor n=1 Tax=Paenibacillus piscarius TaxID=1089681 RepID=UPI001EE9A0A1|nr:RNA polymerase sigma factor [Paenibacillus piscarius]
MEYKNGDSPLPLSGKAGQAPPGEENAVLIRFREGSQEAFEWLVRHYREPAVRFAYHLTGDYYSAEDLAQDCFAYLLVYPEKYDYRASFKTYLFTLVRNKSIDSIRKRARQRSVTLAEEGGRLAGADSPDQLLDGPGSIHTAEEQNPERLAIIREEDREWRRRLLRLKPDYCQAIYLVDLAQLSYEQAAAVMGRGAVSFKVLLHRARKKLRQVYEKEEWDCEVQGTETQAGAAISG